MIQLTSTKGFIIKISPESIIGVVQQDGYTEVIISAGGTIDVIETADEVLALKAGE